VCSETNWVKFDTTLGSHWSARNGHATAVFDNKIWLTGGRGNTFTMYDQVNKQATRFGDVWCFELGDTTWQQKLSLTGNFEEQNKEYLSGGTYAPWYSRFGHTLTPFDMDGDGVDDCMIQIGGFSPDPNNDVWITLDGEHWSFIEYAPFSGRGWHSAIVHEQKLYVMGGSPLNNEIWVTDYVRQLGNDRYQTNWYQITSHVPWMPRAGFGLVIQNRTAAALNDTAVDPEDLGETMYILGGYGGWPSTNRKYDGVRGRNDVWKSRDGENWELVTAMADWASRAWMGALVWHSLGDTTSDVMGGSNVPRIWVAGGGYIGTMGNNIVSTMEAYVDLWWSRDGDSWTQVSFVEGEDSYLKSSQEWALTSDEEDVYIGKYGQTLVGYKRYNTDSSSGTTSTIAVMYMLGGDYVEDGTLDPERSVYYSSQGVLCDIEGVTCNDKGVCNSGNSGCSCTNESYIGEYCERLNPNYKSVASTSSLPFTVMFISIMSVNVIGNWS